MSISTIPTHSKPTGFKASSSIVGQSKSFIAQRYKNSLSKSQQKIKVLPWRQAEIPLDYDRNTNPRNSVKSSSKIKRISVNSSKKDVACVHVKGLAATASNSTQVAAHDNSDLHGQIQSRPLLPNQFRPMRVPQKLFQDAKPPMLVNPNIPLVQPSQDIEV